MKKLYEKYGSYAPRQFACNLFRNLCPNV